MSAITLRSDSADATRACGERLGRAARAGDVILLRGPVGAGKTVLVQGLANGLGCREQVVSPTFVLARQLAGRLQLIHADLYRLEDPAAVTALGLDQLAADGLLVVEWPDLGAAVLPPGASITIEADLSDESARTLVLETAPGHLRGAFLP
ncbi:MAG: tRNA (adenosine(37)-N6)-threonylcarbamoyltransferase complex ATPase subunit type 1 TsaE [Candidatus Dormibacteria bacterium]